MLEEHGRRNGKNDGIEKHINRGMALVRSYEAFNIQGSVSVPPGGHLHLPKPSNGDRWDPADDAVG